MHRDVSHDPHARPLATQKNVVSPRAPAHMISLVSHKDLPELVEVRVCLLCVCGCEVAHSQNGVAHYREY